MKDNLVKSEKLYRCMLNGCFDILHIGHIRLFSFAKSLGYYVIVGLNSDASVKKLKGNDRPIVCEEERKEILESIRYVDEVIIFNEDNPCELIKKIKPDILIKGSDWEDKDIIEKDLVNSIRFFPHQGITTTKIIEKIKL